MTTINNLLDRINEFKSRVGRFSIGKSDFFGFMTDMVNKQKELADRQAADLLGSVDLSGAPAAYPATELGWWKIKTNVVSVDGGDLSGVEVKAGGQLVCDGTTFSYVEDPDLVEVQEKLNENSIITSKAINGNIDLPVLDVSSNYLYDEYVNNVCKTRLSYAVMKEDKIFNKVGIYTRALTNETLDGGILVKLFINGNLISQSTIDKTEIETLSVKSDDLLLITDIGYCRAKAFDVVCVGWQSLGTYKMPLVYKSNSTPSDSNEFTRNYSIQYNTDKLTNMHEAPNLPPSNNYYYTPFTLYFSDTKDKIITTNNLLYPHRLYHTVNDKDASGFTGNNTLPLYIDHFIKKKSVLFNNGKDVIKIINDITMTGYGTAIFNKGVDINSETKTIALNDGRRLNYTMKSTLASAQKRKAFVLVIGDSISYGIGTTNYIDGSPDKGQPFWGTTAQMLEDNKNSFKNLFLGSNRALPVDGGDVACAEARPSWSLFNYMRHMSGLKESSGYSALGFADAWTRSNDQLAAIATTNQVDLGGIPDNPFYDGSLTGSNRFSIAKWLERYRTMDDEGNRLALGDPSLGTEISSQETIDGINVCTPTHIVLALGTNDVYFGTNETYYSNLLEMITTLKTQLPNVIIGIQPVPDTAGSFYPEFYDIEGIERAGGDHNNRFDVYKRVAHDVLDAYNEDVDGVYIIPSFFVAPTANAYTLREVSSPDGAVSKSIFGDETHVSHYAHDNWAYLLYSWIKYTTSK